MGVDLGGTKIEAGLVSPAGEVTATRTAPTPARDGRRAVVGMVCSLVRQLVGSVPESSVIGVGIGSAGVIDPARGVVVAATDAIDGWAGTALADAVAENTGLRARVVNDVHAHPG